MTLSSPAQASLERLAFRNVGFSVHAAAALDELLEAPSALRALSLYNNMTGDEGAAHVARVLARAPALAELSLVSSRVGGEGGVAVVQALQPRAEALSRLDLHDNPITEEAVPALSELLRSATALQALNLNDTGLGDAGAAEIIRVLAETQPPLQVMPFFGGRVGGAFLGEVWGALGGGKRVCPCWGMGSASRGLAAPQPQWLLRLEGG